MLSLDKREIGYIYLYAILSGIITLSLPLGIQAIINFIAGGVINTSWVVLVVVVTLGIILSGVLQVMQLSITETLQQRVFTRAAFEFAYRIPHLHPEVLRKNYAPELVNRFFDVLSVQKGLPKILIDFTTAILQIFFGLILLSFYHPFFVFFGVTLLVLLFVVLRFTAPRGISTSMTESKYKYKTAFWLQDVARNVRLFKLEDMADFTLHHTDHYVEGYLGSRRSHFRVLMVQFGNILAFKTIITALLLILGSILVVNQQINIGQFVASEIIILTITGSVEKLILSMETIYDVLTGVEKMGQFSDLPLEDEHSGSAHLADTSKGLHIVIENTLPHADWPGQPLNLELKPGERVRLRGGERSGKTSLLYLLAGYHLPQGGKVLLDDLPMQNYDLQDLRKHVGDALQGSSLFGGSLKENICLGREDISLEQIKWAAEQAGLMDWVQSKREGFDTIILPDGQGIPESVACRLVIARSIVSRPRLLLLDDITHTLSPESRKQLMRNLTDPANPWTLVAVADAPECTGFFDRVIVL